MHQVLSKMQVLQQADGSSGAASSSGSTSGARQRDASSFMNSTVLRAVAVALAAHIGTAPMTDAVELMHAAGSTERQLVFVGANSAILQGLQRRQVC